MIIKKLSCNHISPLMFLSSHIPWEYSIELIALYIYLANYDNMQVFFRDLWLVVIVVFSAVD